VELLRPGVLIITPTTGTITKRDIPIKAIITSRAGPQPGNGVISGRRGPTDGNAVGTAAGTGEIITAGDSANIEWPPTTLSGGNFTITKFQNLKVVT